ELTFPSGGVAVIENFDQWVLAKGATVTDCKCGGMNLADFVVALGLNPEDVLPAAGGQAGGPQGGTGHPTVALTPSEDLLDGLAHPHILPPTALSYGTPEPLFGFLPIEHNTSLGGPIARDDNPDAIHDVLTVVESTHDADVEVPAGAS